MIIKSPKHDVIQFNNFLVMVSLILKLVRHLFKPFQLDDSVR